MKEAGGHLRQATLTESDWKQFATGVYDLACQREKVKGGFAKFAQALERRDFTIFLDAANIAFYNTLWLTEHGKPNARFQWPQVQTVYAAVKQKYPGQEILVVVNGGRTQHGCVHSPTERAFLDQLQVCCYTRVLQFICTGQDLW